MTKLGGWESICAVLVLCTATAIGSRAQTYNTIHSFNSTDGRDPWGALVQGVDGNFYGSTRFGGAFNSGTVFKITPTGTLTTLHSFCAQTSCPDGSEAGAPLALGTDGSFYGTTTTGGANGFGTVFKITPAGKLTTLYSFCAQANCPDGDSVVAGLVQGTDGNFYGTASGGGVGGFGTVFKITRAGALTTLYSFCPLGFSCADGVEPSAGLVQGTDGNFYGTTTDFGAHSQGGTVFKITPGGKLTTLYSFCALASCADGYNPFKAVLVQGVDGNFYGTTSAGGVHSGGLGTVFKITPGGALTTLHSFCSQTNCTDGITPYTGVVQATDGNFYGTTTSGGSNSVSGYGTVFKITGTGTLTTLYSFCPLGFSCTDAISPNAGLVQGTKGTFYGTATSGGAHDDGTVFSLAVGLGSFVETRPTAGKVGAAVIILGNNLTGATSVSFNGKSATFTVVNSSEIKATVPAGATTGKVKVTTPSATLSSNVAFRVMPQITSFTPTNGPVGTAVTIAGVSLTQTTKVTFGGVKATSFTVTSDSQVSATVPTGAKTGKIVIATAGGMATSATSFTVTP